MPYNYDYERPWPLADEHRATMAQLAYISALADWLKYKPDSLESKVAKVLNKKVVNLRQLTKTEASTVIGAFIDAWKKVQTEGENR